ncbi:carbohydrate ABC transporter permease, partial [Rhizobium ruizarguesonis]
MSAANSAHSVVEPSLSIKRIAGTIVVLYALITLIPLVWIFLTSIK